MQNESSDRRKFVNKITALGAVGAIATLVGLLNENTLTSLFKGKTNDNNVADKIKSAQTASYIIEKVGTVVYAIPAPDSGLTAYEGPDAGTVIQSAEDDIERAGGGKIFFRKETYTITDKLLIDKRHVQWEAESGTVLQGSILPILEIAGNGMDGEEEDILNDVQIKNVKFLYTGEVESGSLIYVHEIQTDKNFQGAVVFEDLVVRSTQTDVQTNEDFVGFRLEDAIGCRIMHLSIAYFGTGYQYTSTKWQGSHNVYYYLTIGYCKRGVWYNNGNTTCETWINPKIMQTTEYGFLADSDGKPMQLVMICPQFETILGKGALDVKPYSLQVTNGVFSEVVEGDGIAIKFHDPEDGENKHALLTQNQFGNCVTAIKTASETVLMGNTYGSVNTKVELNGAYARIEWGDEGYVVENSGKATLIHGNTTVDVTHGLSAGPTGVYLTPTNDSGGKRYWVSAKGSSTFTISIDSSHTSDIYFDWQATIA